MEGATETEGGVVAQTPKDKPVEEQPKATEED